MASMHSRIFALAATILASGLNAAAQSCDWPPVPPYKVDAARIASRDVRIGLALGSGSMHGLAHVGVLQAIEESGLPVRVVTGTSVGAVVGSLWASGVDAAHIAALGQARDLEGLHSFSPGSGGLLSNEPLRIELEKMYPDSSIDAWPMRFGAVATNVDDGSVRLLASGNGALAVQASAASPVMFGPVKVRGERLADGALVEPVPVKAARQLGADFVIAVDVAYRPYEEPVHGIVQSGFQALNILVNSLSTAQLAQADYAVRLDVHDTLMRCGNAGVIALGRDAMRRALPQIEIALRARGAAHQARR